MHAHVQVKWCWVQAIEKYLVEDTVKLPVQVNGKMRGTVEVGKEESEEAALAAAVQDPGVARFVDGKSIKKVIYKSGRILNIIV